MTKYIWNIMWIYDTKSHSIFANCKSLFCLLFYYTREQLIHEIFVWFYYSVIYFRLLWVDYNKSHIFTNCKLVFSATIHGGHEILCDFITWNHIIFSPTESMFCLPGQHIHALWCCQCCDKHAPVSLNKWAQLTNKEATIFSLKVLGATQPRINPGSADADALWTQPSGPIFMDRARMWKVSLHVHGPVVSGIVVVVVVVVFLGGSCNPTTWRRDEAIPFLKEHDITFYNPVSTCNRSCDPVLYQTRQCESQVCSAFHFWGNTIEIPEMQFFKLHQFYFAHLYVFLIFLCLMVFPSCKSFFNWNNGLHFSLTRSLISFPFFLFDGSEKHWFCLLKQQWKLPWPNTVYQVVS